MAIKPIERVAGVVFSVREDDGHCAIGELENEDEGIGMWSSFKAVEGDYIDDVIGKSLPAGLV